MSEEEELTLEQRERIRRNRERALEIQRQRRQARTLVSASSGPEEEAVVSAITPPPPKRPKATKGEKVVEEEDVVLEDFEIGASEWVTKKEATKMYCLPEGTLAVCQFQEKQNPHRKGWTAMKLYSRAEIRRRARQRFGGLEGLQAERRRREEKRFLNDLEKTKNVFRKTESSK